MYPHLKEAGDHEVAGNNRPISLLPVLSKVLKRVAHPKEGGGGYSLYSDDRDDRRIF